MTSRTGHSEKSSNVTPDKGHRKNLVASSPFRKDPINPIETSEYYGYKPFYTGSDNPFTERSHDEDNIEIYKLMDKLSNRGKEDAEDSEERKTLFKTLMKINFQNNIIQYTLTNIISIDEKINEAHKHDVNINKSGKWEFSQSIPLQYLLSADNRLPLSRMENNMVINEKEFFLINFKLDIC